MTYGVPVNPPAPPPPSSSSSSNVVKIVVPIACVLGVLALGGLGAFLWQRRKKKRQAGANAAAASRERQSQRSMRYTQSGRAISAPPQPDMPPIQRPPTL